MEFENALEDWTYKAFPGHVKCYICHKYIYIFPRIVPSLCISVGASQLLRIDTVMMSIEKSLTFILLVLFSLCFSCLLVLMKQPGKSHAVRNWGQTLDNPEQGTEALRSTVWEELNPANHHMNKLRNRSSQIDCWGVCSSVQDLNYNLMIDLKTKDLANLCQGP